MRIIGAAEVHRLLEYPALIKALDKAHREEPPITARSFLEPRTAGRPAGEGFLVLPAWSEGRGFGAKLVTLLPDNAKADGDLPTVQAVYVYFDGATGAPLATIDGAALTLRKTAADSALGSSFLSRDDSETLLMVGAGALAPHLIAAHLAARPGLRIIAIWNRTPARRDTVIEQWNGAISIEPADDLEAAVRTADIITVATMATEPLIHGSWLKSGAHIDLVGGFTPEMREADNAAIARASVFVDSFDTTVGVAGDIVRPMEEGVLEENNILADLYALCRGDHPGRGNDQQITLYKNGGGGHLDLFTAQHLVNLHAAEKDHLAKA